MPSRDIFDLKPDLQALCKEFLAKTHAEGIHTFLTCTLRTNEEQDELYAQGRTKLGKIVTNARAGQSKHNTGSAFDFAIRNDDGSLNWDTKTHEWQRAGQIGVELGLVWGGNWKSIKDYAHMELKDA